MNRRLFAILTAALLLVAAAMPAGALARSARQLFTQDGTYIVQLAQLPAVAYDGSIKGYRATKPATGAKIDPNSATVVRYIDYLRSRHDAELNAAGGGRKLYDYAFSFNGFAAVVSAATANKLAADPDVVAVTRDQLYTVDTSSTPNFLGLTDEGGLWDQLGGVGSAGDGLIVGVIDSGIWPESLSFTDRVDSSGVPSASGKKVFQQIPGWHGKCVPGEDFNASMCNQKLIGAQYFNAGYGGNAGINADRPWEFNSARDYNGHGTHTSSTAAGNNDVPTTGLASVFGPVSGMAPHARVAMYKALWSTEDASTASGYGVDLVAAIDQAVADGVDVINYSISGTLTNFLDAVQVSFLYAADAGIFVAASAGNSGPTTSTVAHPGPWLTTVAAGTHNRAGTGSVTVNGTTYEGASLAASEVTAPLINSTDAALSGADPEKARLCYAAVDNGGDPVLDPALVAGKIVVCDRGVTARVDKSLAVEEAGGAGMILLNTSVSGVNADFHFVPSVHLEYNAADYAAIHAYASTAGAMATIHKATISYDAPAPFTASFSSRGPLQAGAGDLLKPDLMAPGVDILAAVAPPGNHGFDFNLYSGTSMSSPHVAGLAALLMDLHPDWSPMMVKSALMTSAYDVLDGPDTNPTVIFRQGAGYVRPNSAADPGLVYNSGWNDWLAFLCGTTNGVGAGTCSALQGMGYSLDPSDFNGPSIAIGALAGSQTITRKVTNVGNATATYEASYTGMAGMSVTVAPQTFSLAPGHTQTFTVTFTRTTAALNVYTGGQLTWSDGTHSVRSPMVVRPVALAAPAEVSGTGGAISYDVTFGYTGQFTATGRGLVPADKTAGVVAQDPDQSFDPNDPVGNYVVPVTIPAGTTYARFNLFDADVDPGSDIDLYVYRGSTLVGSSGTGTSTEQVNLVNPTPADYTVYVHGWGPADGVSTPFVLYTWLLGSTEAGNMTVSAPTSAVTGDTATIELTFSGLNADTKYLGSVAYSGSSSMPNPTIVRVDMP